MFQDLRFSWRLIRRNPAALMIGVLTLGLGLGANVATFSVVNAALVRPLPFAEPRRLVLGLSAVPEEGSSLEAVSFLEYRDWRERASAFEDLAAASLATTLTMTGGARATSLVTEFASANYLDLLGIEPILGRTFDEHEEMSPGAAPVAILSYVLWQDQFGGDPAVLGRTIRLDEILFEVIGVLPREFRGLMWDRVDIWVPTGAAHQLLGEENLGRRRRWLATVARLRPGVTLAQARESMQVLTAALEAEHPILHDGRRATLLLLRNAYFDPTLRRQLLFVLLASAIVLLTCCGNVASLLLSQVLQRRREIALRVVLGAGPWRLARLFSLHALVVSSLGALLALGLSAALTEPLVALSDLRPATFRDNYVDQRVLSLAGALAVVTSLAFGTVPALVLSRARVAEALKEAPGSGRGRGARRWRNALVLGEVAAAMILLSAAVLMVRSWRGITRGDPGFDVERLVAIQVDLPRARYDDAAAARFAQRLRDEVATLPGVDQVGASGSQLAPWAFYQVEVVAEGGGPDDLAGVPAFRHSVLPDHFAVLGVPLLGGRDFRMEDDAASDRVAVVSSSLAERLWPGQSPLGRRLSLPGSDPEEPRTPVTVVGLVRDLRHRGFLDAKEEDRDLYLPLAQQPLHRFHLLLRTGLPLQSLTGSVRERVAALDPDLPFDRFETMRSRFALSGADDRMATLMASIFSLIALTLTVVGLYAVLSLSVGERRREIAVRLALGGTRGDLWRLVLRQALRMVVPGILIGIAGFFSLRQLLSSFLHGVEPGDPATLLGVALLLLLVAFLATTLPVWRALRVDPATALREE